MDNTSSYCAAASTVREAGRCLAKHTKFRKVGKVYQAKNYLKYIIPVIIVMLIVNFPKEGFWSPTQTIHPPPIITRLSLQKEKKGLKE